MDEILHQLGGLLIGSVPTIILFLFIVILYRFLVYGPLTRVLDERRARTQGAVERAHAAITAADAKTLEYEAGLRSAHMEIFHTRQQRLEQWNRERENALAAAREAARKQIAAARSALQGEAETARHTLESSVEQLAKEILRAILPTDLAADLATPEGRR